MDTKEIQESTDVAVLGLRLHSPEIRKKERRLIHRKITRLLKAMEVVVPVPEKKKRAPRKKKEETGEPVVKKARLPRVKKTVE